MATEKPNTPETNAPEKWVVHLKAEMLSEPIIKIWPMIRGFHQLNIKDIIYVDIARIHQLVDKDGKIIKERFDTRNPFWTKSNPFPINSIASDEEILSVWDRKPSGSQNIILTQLKKDVQILIDMKNQKPEKTTLILVNYIREIKCTQELEGVQNEKVEYPRIMTCLMVREVETKPTEDEPFTTQLVLTPEPVIIFS